VYVGYSGTFTMNIGARISATDEVCLYRNGYNSGFITIAEEFSVGGSIVTIDLLDDTYNNGSIADWLGRNVLKRDFSYLGPLPLSRFKLGSFIRYNSKTPIVGYVINSEGVLVAE
jgi:hypothetical protein